MAIIVRRATFSDEVIRKKTMNPLSKEVIFPSFIPANLFFKFTVVDCLLFLSSLYSQNINQSKMNP